MIFGVVCFNVKYVNFGTQNLRSSNVKVIFQRPSCDVPYSGGLLASGFIAGTAQCPCGCIYNMEDILRGLVKEVSLQRIYIILDFVTRMCYKQTAALLTYDPSDRTAHAIIK